MNRAFYLESGRLRESGFSHAFFTRLGGVSEGPYESLNFSVTVGDAESNVRVNLGRAAEVLGVDPARVYYLSQVHGRDVCVLAGTESRDAVVEERGDALVSGARGVACGVRIADCVPILIGDPRSGAVAAVHAGWRGVVRGVIAAALAELSRVAATSFGDFVPPSIGDVAAPSASDFVAAIGPHISVRAFEVGEDVAAELAAVAPSGVSALDIVHSDEQGAKPHVDLRRLVRAQLRAEGLVDANIDDVGGCTLSEPELYFSFRRDGARSGRHLAAIVPRV